MSALGFLAIAGVICLVGFGILYLRSRQPTSIESGVDAFKREMHALSPQDDHVDRGPSGHAPGPRREA